MLKHSVDGSAVKVPSDVAGSVRAKILSRIHVRLGDLEKKLANPPRSEKNTHFGNVRGGLLHDQVELMCVAVGIVGIWVHIFYFPLHTCSSTHHMPGRLAYFSAPQER